MLPRASTVNTAIVLFSLGIFFFAVNDAIGKWLVTGYPVGQIILLRTIGAACFLLPMLYRDRARLAIPKQWGLHLLRVFVMTIDSFSFFFATRTLPLADVMTFYLAAPLFITALSVFVLGEAVGPLRWTAVIIGFAGVIIALKPTGAAFSAGAMIALLGSMMFATAIIITRKLRETHWLTLIAWQFVGAGAVGAVASSFAWVTPNTLDVVLMLLIGLVSMLCFISINQALRLAHASLLAPFHYMSIVWAVALGWAIWGDIPSPPVICGVALIVASGLVVWHRESSAKRAAVRVAGDAGTIH